MRRLNLIRYLRRRYSSGYNYRVSESAPIPSSPLDSRACHLDIKASDLTESLLYTYLSAGIPIVVRGVSGWEAGWTATELAHDLGPKCPARTCTVVDCETRTLMNSTLPEFFEEFGKTPRSTKFAQGSGIWKLKVA